MFDRWFAEQVQASIRICRIGSILLIPGAVAVAFVTWWIVWMTIGMGLGVLFKLSWGTIDLLTYGFLAALFVWQFTAGRTFKEAYSFSGRNTSELEISLMQASGYGWAYIFEPGVAGGLVRVLSLLYLTAPRMVALAIMLHQRAGRLQQMDVDNCGRLMSLLLKAQGRVSFDEIERALPGSELQQLIPPLADVDGVVFLNKDGPALTLAPRVAEEYAKWRTESPSEPGA